MQKIIKAQNIYKSFFNSLGDVKREVLKDLTLEVNSCEKIAIMGPSGSGKTTLLNLLAGFDSVDSGSIIVDGLELKNMNKTEILEYRNKTVGFVFQFHHLLPQCTLFENVLLPTLPDKKRKTEKQKRAEELLEYMNILEQRNNFPEELSGGECQRAAVVRSLINQPKILLADEPTGSLDTKNAESLINLLCDINEKMKVTLIVATHSMDIAQKMDKIYTIKDSKLELLT